VGTPLKSVPTAVCNLRSPGTLLKSLSLAFNDLLALPVGCFKDTSGLAGLVTLDASYNDISQLQDRVFRRLWKLETLLLSNNNISYIGLKVFSRTDLPELMYLDLSDNQLASIEPWPMILGTHRLSFPKLKVVEVNLARNAIVNFTNLMNWIYCW